MNDNDKPNCPFCGSKFGQSSEFMSGCTDDDCPERPRFHDPVGRRDYVDEFWEETIKLAPAVKKMAHIELELQKIMVKMYYE